MDTQEKDHFSQALSDAIEEVSKFVIPIYVEHCQRPQLLGSGFFLQTSSFTILVSAAHVLAEASEANPIFTYKTPYQPQGITGKRYLSNPQDLDLGFVVTEDIQLPWPEVAKFPCPISYLHSARLPREDKHYVIAGYPKTKNRANPLKRSIRAATHAYHAHSIPDDTYGAYNLTPEQSVALPLDLEETFDFHGNRVHFPKPQGMSGSPIWELYDKVPTSSETRGFPLVAVGTTYSRKQGILYGTDIGHLLLKLENANLK